MRRRAFNLPNLLTYGRILAVPLILLCFYLEGRTHPTDFARWTALAIYVIASITDYLDGYLARIWEQTSNIGRMLDPIADKLLVSACLLIGGGHSIKQAYRWAAVLAILGLATAAYFRPDPLAPVPYVEQVFQLAFSGGLANLVAVLVCATSLLIPFATDAPAERKRLAFAFLAYFICCFAATQLGNFPVPVLGAGAGPVLGWCFALVLLTEPACNGRGPENVTVSGRKAAHVRFFIGRFLRND